MKFNTFKDAMKYLEDEHPERHWYSYKLDKNMKIIVEYNLVEGKPINIRKFSYNLYSGLLRTETLT
jgi:hypothetical protein